MVRVSLTRRGRRASTRRAHRLQLIQELRWELGTTVLPKTIVDNVHRLELEFFNKYQNLLAAYMMSLNGLDLTLVRPTTRRPAHRRPARPTRRAPRRATCRRSSS